MIDNSASICIDSTGTVLGQSDMTGTCADGKPEFPPVHDTHIGTVCSSLGGRGGNECSPAEMNPADANLRSPDPEAHGYPTNMDYWESQDGELQ